MDFVNKHPWMTFFLGLVTISAVAEILGPKTQTAAGLVGALPPRRLILPHVTGYGGTGFVPPQYRALPQYTPVVQHRGVVQNQPSVQNLPRYGRQNILFRS